MLYCEACGLSNDDNSDVCAKCGRSLLSSQDTLVISSYISPKLLNSGMVIGSILIIVAFLVASIPFLQYLQQRIITSSLTALLALGIVVVGLQLFLVSLMANMYLNDFFIQKYYTGKQRLSLIRIIIINIKDRFFLYLTALGIISLFLALISGFSTVQIFLATGMSAYPMSATLGFGFGIVAVIFLSNAFIMYLLTHHITAPK